MTDPSVLNGLLIVDKPTGPTSHDIVACARRALGLKKVGHLGTLDPLATGVLPLVIGRATRLASLLTGTSKQYCAVIRLGLVTDTYDITGTVVGRVNPPHPETVPPTDSRMRPPTEEITRAVTRFVGSYSQVPPPFSAKKVNGVRAYNLARNQRPVKVLPKVVNVDELTILSIDGPLVQCRVVCSAGFYVRSLAHDLGKVLGCGGCLESLRRERHGPFTLQSSMPLDRLIGNGESTAAELVPMHSLLTTIPAVTVSDQGARRAIHGNLLRATDLALGRILPPPNAARVRVFDRHERLLAIADRRADGTLHPKIVLV